MEAQKSEVLRRYIPLIGLLAAVPLGYINSIYTDRFPHYHGDVIQYIVEIFVVGLSNPYA